MSASKSALSGCPAASAMTATRSIAKTFQFGKSKAVVSIVASFQRAGSGAPTSSATAASRARIMGLTQGKRPCVEPSAIA